MSDSAASPPRPWVSQGGITFWENKGRLHARLGVWSRYVPTACRDAYQAGYRDEVIRKWGLRDAV